MHIASCESNFFFNGEKMLSAGLITVLPLELAFAHLGKISFWFHLEYSTVTFTTSVCISSVEVFIKIQHPAVTIHTPEITELSSDLLEMLTALHRIMCRNRQFQDLFCFHKLLFLGTPLTGFGQSIYYVLYLYVSLLVLICKNGSPQVAEPAWAPG